MSQLAFCPFLKNPIQEHEREVSEEGKRLDYGEEGEKKTTGTVRMQLRNCNSLTKIFLFGMLSYDISTLTVDIFSPVLCLLACREVRADTKYTGRQRRPHF